MVVLCPRCHESNVRRSHRRPHDIVPRLLGMVALRCNLCNHRFFRLRRVLRRATAGQITAQASVHLPVSR